MRNFFNINTKYAFEWNDLRAVITVINVALIMCFGLSIAWFGLAVAVLGLIKDLAIDRRINGTIMHLANIILNTYFLFAYYGLIAFQASFGPGKISLG